MYLYSKNSVAGSSISCTVLIFIRIISVSVGNNNPSKILGLVSFPEYSAMVSKLMTMGAV
jgi:hypothetical protein